MQYSDLFVCTIYTRIDTDIATVVKRDLKFTSSSRWWLLMFFWNLLTPSLR